MFELKAELNRQAAARGVEIDANAASSPQPATQRSGPPQIPGVATEPVATVVRSLATFGKRHGLSLGGSTIKELLRESRP